MSWVHAGHNPFGIAPFALDIFNLNGGVPIHFEFIPVEFRLPGDLN